MTFLNRRLFDNVSVFVDSLSGANRVAFDVNKPNGILTLAISGNIVGDNVKVGTGSPEGAVVGKIGDVYQRKDGGANTSLYIKESGSGNTGWTALGAPVSGGGSLSGGVQNRAAIWGTSSSISASHIISEGSDEITIRGTTIVTTAKADGSTWNSIIIRDGMEGGVNDNGDHAGSRILYESSDGPNPYRASIEFGVNVPGMDSESRMVLGTQRAYYDPIIPGITIAGGTVSNGGGVYIKTSESLPNNQGETVQISGSLLTSEEITARDGVIVSSLGSPTVQLKTASANYSVENFIAEFGFSTNTIGSSMPLSGARIITYGNTPLIIKTKFAENPAGNTAIFNTTGNLLLKTKTDNNVDTLQVSGGAAISGALVSFNIRRGTGSPEGVVTATLGTIYQRTDGGTSTSVYIKETNTGNTGWTAIAPGSSGAGGGIGGSVLNEQVVFGSGTNAVSSSNTLTFSLTGGFSSNVSAVSGSEYFGKFAGNNNATGGFNTSLGFGALRSITSGTHNITIGYLAGNLLSSSSRNIVVGANALRASTSTSSDNVVIGHESMLNSFGANRNVTLGQYTGKGITSGADNVVIGYNAANSGITTGIFNTVIGSGAVITSAVDRNTILGAGATVGGNSSSDNIAIGYGASLSNSNTNKSIAIGSSASVSDSGSIVLGGDASCTFANTFVAGSSTYPVYGVYFGQGRSATTPVAYMICGTRGSGSNKNGGGLILAGGPGTGTGNGGSITFRTAPLGGTGSSENALFDRLYIDSQGALSWFGMTSAPSASPIGTGSIYFNSSEGKFKVSQSGSAYVDLVSAGSSGSLSGGIAGQAAIWSGTNSISASSLITELTSEVRIASPVSATYVIAGESSATTASPRRILMGYDSVGSGSYSIQPVHQSIAWTNLSLNENGGNVLIGTTTDNGADKLQVNGSAAISGAVRLANIVKFEGIGTNTSNLSGEFYYNQTKRAFVGRTGGYVGFSDTAAYALQNVRYSAGGRLNLNNSAVETNLSDQNVPGSSNFGSADLLPKYWVGGKRIKITAYGVIQNTGTPTLRIRVNESNSGTVLHDTGAVTMSSITSFRHWQAEYYIHCLSISGTAANLITNGTFQYGTTANAPLTCINVGTSIPVPILYADINTLNISAQFGTPSTSNGITANDYFIEEIG